MSQPHRRAPSGLLVRDRYRQSLASACHFRATTASVRRRPTAFATPTNAERWMRGASAIVGLRSRRATGTPSARGPARGASARGRAVVPGKGRRSGRLGGDSKANPDPRNVAVGSEAAAGWYGPVRRVGVWCWRVRPMSPSASGPRSLLKEFSVIVKEFSVIARAFGPRLGVPKGDLVI